MRKNIIKPLIIPISLVALSGVLIHVNQVGNITRVFTRKLDEESNHHIVSHITSATKDTHVDIPTFTSDTFNLRTQPPSAPAKPQDDDDSEDNAKRRQVDDDYVTPSRLII